MANENFPNFVPMEKEHNVPFLTWLNAWPPDRIMPFNEVGKYSLESLPGLLDGFYSKFIINLGMVPVGFGAVSAIDWINRKARISVYVSGPAAHHRDIESQAILFMLERCFSDIGCNKISCDILSGNVFLIKMYEKIGFKVDVRKRQHLFRDGAYHHVCELSLTQKKWLEFLNGNKIDSNGEV